MPLVVSSHASPGTVEVWEEDLIIPRFRRPQEGPNWGESHREILSSIPADNVATFSYYVHPVELGSRS